MVVCDSGLASLESRAQSEQIQDANSKVHLVSDPTPRLVCDHRSKGCILSHPDRQEFLRFAFASKVYQYCVLPFGLALAPWTFTKCMDIALAPLRLQGIHIFNYLDDWLILARSQDQAWWHRDLVLYHLWQGCQTQSPRAYSRPRPIMDPVHCPIGSVLEYLQISFSEGVTPVTLKVYVAAISVWHALIGDVSVGRHPLVSRFMQGARRIRPFRPIWVPSWDLSIVLEGLLCPPFEPLESMSVKLLTLKTVLLLALSSLKRALRVWTSPQGW